MSMPTGRVNIQDLVLVAAAFGQCRCRTGQIASQDGNRDHKSRSGAMVASRPTIGSHRPDFSTRHPFLRTPLGSANPDRDGTSAELPETPSIQRRGYRINYQNLRLSH